MLLMHKFDAYNNLNITLNILNKMSYTETVKSRFDDIIKDGPNIYTALLEIIDNMIDWGKADSITIQYLKNCPDKSRPLIILKDNGPNGFNTEESIHRLFQLGKTNGAVTEKTIGKYGKGGYKGIISISDIFELTTFMDEKEYNYGTNFRLMEDNNSWDPTGEWKMKNNKKEKGSIFKLYPSFHSGISDTFNFDDLKRHIIRGYHKSDQKISFLFKNGAKQEMIDDIREKSPYMDFSKKEIYSVYLENERNDITFVCEKGLKENKEPLAIITSYILKDLITKNELLGSVGNKTPGIDFYRNTRMCNTRYPIAKIRNIGSLLQKGMMRGKRCHMTFEFSDKKISEDKSFDDYIGVTTVKDIYEEDNIMHESLIEILENIAEECADMYEKYANEKKESIFKHLNEIDSYSDNITKDLLLSENNLEQYKEEIESFLEFKMFYYDESLDKISFAKSQADVLELKKTGEKAVRSNSTSYTFAYRVFDKLTQRIAERENIKRCETHIEKIMQEKQISRQQAIDDIQRDIEIQKVNDKKAREKRELEEKTKLERLEAERLEKERLEQEEKDKKKSENRKKKMEQERLKQEKLDKEILEEEKRLQQIRSSQSYKEYYTKLEKIKKEEERLSSEKEKMMNEEKDLFTLVEQDLV